MLNIWGFYWLHCLFVLCSVGFSFSFSFLFFFFLPKSKSLRRDKIWNVLPLYRLVMANSLAYMAKAKLILNKEKHWFYCFSSYCYWYRLSILVCLLKYISKILVSSLPDRALKTHGICVETNLTALTGDENKTEGAVVVLAEQLYQNKGQELQKQHGVGLARECVNPHC